LSPAISITNNKAISSTGSVGPTTTTTCLVTKFDFNLMWWSETLWKPGSNSDGDMSRYFIDKEQQFRLDTDED
jgi:hypothetical protein